MNWSNPLQAVLAESQPGEAVAKRGQPWQEEKQTWELSSKWEWASQRQQAITQKKEQQLNKKQQQLRKKQQQLSHPSLLQTHPHLSKKATVMKSSRPVADSPSSKQKQNPRTSLTEARQTCYVTAILFPDWSKQAEARQEGKEFRSFFQTEASRLRQGNTCYITSHPLKQQGKEFRSFADWGQKSGKPVA